MESYVFYVVRRKSTDVSEEYVAFTFRDQELVKHESGLKKAASKTRSSEKSVEYKALCATS
jgi:hypothetical protein